VYSGPITVSTTMTLEAVALANGYKASAAASAIECRPPLISSFIECCPSARDLF
jgi:hypothetical protein